MADQDYLFPSSFTELSDLEIISDLITVRAIHCFARRTGIVLSINEMAFDRFLSSWSRRRTLFEQKYGKSVPEYLEPAQVSLVHEMIFDTMEELCFCICLLQIVSDTEYIPNFGPRTAEDEYAILHYPSEWLGLMLACIGYRTYSSRLFRMSEAKVLPLVSNPLKRSDVIQFCAEAADNPQTARAIFRRLADSVSRKYLER